MKGIGKIRKALRIFAPRACSVVHSERIGTCLQRVRFEGEALKGLMPISPGEQVSVLAEGLWPAGGRNYSISDFASDGRWVEVIAHLHGNGPGARAFANFKPGDSSQLWGPGGGFTFPNDGLTRIYVGDETAVGTFLSVLFAEPEFTAIAAVDDFASAQAIEALHPRMRSVVRPTSLPNDLERDDILLESVRDQLHRNDLRFILAGRTRSLHRLRSELLRLGVPSQRISIRAFWDDRV